MIPAFAPATGWAVARQGARKAPSFGFSVFKGAIALYGMGLGSGIINWKNYEKF